MSSTGHIIRIRICFIGHVCVGVTCYSVKPLYVTILYFYNHHLSKSSVIAAPAFVSDKKRKRPNVLYLFFTFLRLEHKNQINFSRSKANSELPEKLLVSHAYYLIINICCLLNATAEMMP